MILADKITDLRKKNGWSQEELANQLGVSRQAVSKWESSSSIPDLDKIIRMSNLFEVSTDYLLKDSLEEQSDDRETLENRVVAYGTNEENILQVSMETANVYLNLLQNVSSKIALGVSLCILSPVILIGLAGLSAEEGGTLFQRRQQSELE